MGEKARKRRERNSAPVGSMIEGAQPSPNKAPGPWVLRLLPNFTGRLIYPAHHQP